MPMTDRWLRREGMAAIRSTFGGQRQPFAAAQFRGVRCDRTADRLLAGRWTGENRDQDEWSRSMFIDDFPDWRTSGRNVWMNLFCFVFVFFLIIPSTSRKRNRRFHWRLTVGVGGPIRLLFRFVIGFVVVSLIVLLFLGFFWGVLVSTRRRHSAVNAPTAGEVIRTSAHCLSFSSFYIFFLFGFSSLSRRVRFFGVVFVPAPPSGCKLKWKTTVSRVGQRAAMAANSFFFWLPSSNNSVESDTVS